MKRLKKNKELSGKFGFDIYDSQNKYFPYYVKCCDECMTIEEIEERAESIRWHLGIDETIQID